MLIAQRPSQYLFVPSDRCAVNPGEIHLALAGPNSKSRLLALTSALNSALNYFQAVTDGADGSRSGKMGLIRHILCSELCSGWPLESKGFYANEIQGHLGTARAKEARASAKNTAGCKAPRRLSSENFRMAATASARAVLM